ncbi:HRT2 [[Candida] subhashii]|uniref:Sugar phosphate phosphatase n=1 Tax=[Candida] subhashii TaxID=561895 RepID=A0A8J5QP01_9ASCO|nr:HRT2 [[Candida] subhashii]KAG7665203.1 HRT2 [[Candida] subhashii]
MSLPPPYYNDDPKSFAYPTIHKRWPTIIEGAIDDVKAAPTTKYSSESQAKILQQLQDLLKAFKNDEVVREFTQDEILLNPDLIHYNKALIDLHMVKKVTWQTGPWLYLECYLYQYINNFFLESEWDDFDIFENLKTKTFKQSESGVLELCKRYESLANQIKDLGESDDTLKLLFHEFCDISLWGNATDLSLLAGNVTLEDIKSVQGAEVRKKNEEKILINDLDQAWEWYVNKRQGSRVDIVLDNSGFELFADLILVLFLLDSKLSKEVHLHCKEIPWFVSDTMPKDFQDLLNQLKDSEFYPNIHQEHPSAIELVYQEIKNYYESGKIIIDHDPFWTLHYNYWDIPKFDQLYSKLLKSDLIIFKGDLNYRKLTGDLQWDKTTPFKTAIQQLDGSKLPILSLRTCKADVVVGLPAGINEKLIEEYKKMGNEIGEFWSSSGKWAVVSFNNGE